MNECILKVNHPDDPSNYFDYLGPYLAFLLKMHFSVFRKLQRSPLKSFKRIIMSNKYACAISNMGM